MGTPEELWKELTFVGFFSMILFPEPRAGFSTYLRPTVSAMAARAVRKCLVLTLGCLVALRPPLARVPGAMLLQAFAMLPLVCADLRFRYTDPNHGGWLARLDRLLWVLCSVSVLRWLGRMAGEVIWGEDYGFRHWLLEAAFPLPVALWHLIRLR